MLSLLRRCFRPHHPHRSTRRQLPHSQWHAVVPNPCSCITPPYAIFSSLPPLPAFPQRPQNINIKKIPYIPHAPITPPCHVPSGTTQPTHTLHYTSQHYNQPTPLPPIPIPVVPCLHPYRLPHIPPTTRVYKIDRPTVEGLQNRPSHGRGHQPHREVHGAGHVILLFPPDARVHLHDVHAGE